MRYNKQKLEQMTLEELRAIAVEYNLGNVEEMNEPMLVSALVSAQAAAALDSYQAREEAV